MFLGSSTPKSCLFQGHIIMLIPVTMCIVFGCCVLWAGLNSDSLPIPPIVVFRRTGKMVKKVCPCNQLCSNYLSFWSFLPPSIHTNSSILALALPRFLPPSDALSVTAPTLCQIWDPLTSVISAKTSFAVSMMAFQGKSSLRAEITEVCSLNRSKLTAHAPASSPSLSHTHKMCQTLTHTSCPSRSSQPSPWLLAWTT